MNANNQTHDVRIIRWGVIQRLMDDMATLKDQFLLTEDATTGDQLLKQMESLRRQIHDLIQLPGWGAHDA